MNAAPTTSSQTGAGPATVALEQQKAELRRAARATRQAAAEASADAGRQLARRLFASVTIEPDAPVSGYWPIKAELDLRPALGDLAARGHPIGLPVIVARGEPLLFRQWSPGDALIEAGFGTLIPTEDKAELSPRVLLVPLLSFDRDGYRLGYGGGFYDRTLARLRERQQTLAVGVAFAAQETGAVPRDRFDQRLDWIVTEREAIRIA